MKRSDRRRAPLTLEDRKQQLAAIGDAEFSRIMAELELKPAGGLRAAMQSGSSKLGLDIGSRRPWYMGLG